MDQIEAFTLAIYIHNELKYNQPENSAKKQKAKKKATTGNGNLFIKKLK